MKFEIIEFYALKTKNKKFRGTLHVYLPDYKMDIRGIDVYQQKNNIVLQMPYKKGFDEEKKEINKYVLVTFSDITIKDFIIELKAIAVPYLIEKLKDWKPLNELKPKARTQSKFGAKKPYRKEVTTLRKNYGTVSTTNFRDPPPRSFQRSAHKSPSVRP